MSVPIVICDDSNMARKQMRRCLPKDWDVDITFAENGEDAISALEQGLGEILFLDLTMPVMDGFETLAAIRYADLDTMIIVVSGDVQAEAYKRVMDMGAMDFIQKPASVETVSDILDRYGIHRSADTIVLECIDNVTVDETVVDEHGAEKKGTPAAVSTLVLQSIQFDAYREITNIAVGRAGKLLSQLVGEFVNLPIPTVNLLEVSELEMLIHSSTESTISAVCQGFIAPGIAGEALLLIGDSDLPPMVELLGHENSSAVEVLSDISGILLGAILKGLGEQLHLTFSQGYPSVLGIHTNAKELLESSKGRWQKTLAIEISYVISTKDIHCDVLLLFTEGSMKTINERIL